MYKAENFTNELQFFTQKEGSEYSPYMTVNVGEFATAFIISKKEIITNELCRISVMASTSKMHTIDVNESLDNIERQYYRAISVTNPDVKFKIFTLFRVAIEDELKKIGNISEGLERIKQDIFNEIQKAFIV